MFRRTLFFTLLITSVALAASAVVVDRYSTPYGLGFSSCTREYEWRFWVLKGVIHFDHVPLADPDVGKGWREPRGFTPYPTHDTELGGTLYDNTADGNSISEKSFAGVPIETGLHGVNDSPWHYKPYWAVAVPMWMIVCAPLIIPVPWIARKLRRAKHRRANQCASCGYDLRATPLRCPECGAVPKI